MKKKSEWLCEATGLTRIQIIIVVFFIITFIMPFTSFTKTDYWNDFTQAIFSVALCFLSIAFGYIHNKEQIKKEANQKWLELILHQCRVLKYQKSRIKKRQFYQDDFCKSVISKIEKNTELKSYIEQGCRNLIRCMECMETDIIHTLKIMERFAQNNCVGSDCELIISILEENNEMEC